MKPIHIDTETIINEKLPLNATGEEQDWEIELANGDRLEEFIDYAKNYKVNDEEDYAVMALVAASFDLLISGRITHLVEDDYYELFDRHEYKIEKIYTKEEIDLWEQVKGLIFERYSLFGDIVEYWAVPDPDNNPYASTAFYRSLKPS